MPPRKNRRRDKPLPQPHSFTPQGSPLTNLPTEVFLMIFEQLGNVDIHSLMEVPVLAARFLDKFCLITTESKSALPNFTWRITKKNVDDLRTIDKRKAIRFMAEVSDETRVKMKDLMPLIVGAGVKPSVSHFGPSSVGTTMISPVSLNTTYENVKNLCLTRAWMDRAVILFPKLENLTVEFYWCWTSSYVVGPAPEMRWEAPLLTSITLKDTDVGMRSLVSMDYNHFPNLKYLTLDGVNSTYLRHGQARGTVSLRCSTLVELTIRRCRFAKYDNLDLDNVKRIDISCESCPSGGPHEICNVAAPKLEHLSIKMRKSYVRMSDFSAPLMTYLSLEVKGLMDVSTYTNLHFPKLEDAKIHFVEEVSCPTMLQLSCFDSLKSLDSFGSGNVLGSCQNLTSLTLQLPVPENLAFRFPHLKELNFAYKVEDMSTVSLRSFRGLERLTFSNLSADGSNFAIPLKHLTQLKHLTVEVSSDLTLDGWNPKFLETLEIRLLSPKIDTTITNCRFEKLCSFTMSRSVYPKNRKSWRTQKGSMSLGISAPLLETLDVGMTRIEHLNLSKMPTLKHLSIRACGVERLTLASPLLETMQIIYNRKRLTKIVAPPLNCLYKLDCLMTSPLSELGLVAPLLEAGIVEPQRVLRGQKRAHL